MVRLCAGKILMLHLSSYLGLLSAIQDVILIVQRISDVEPCRPSEGSPIGPTDRECLSLKKVVLWSKLQLF
jgi:hypothetical protein